jgi:hypothetical protein
LNFKAHFPSKLKIPFEISDTIKRIRDVRYHLILIKHCTYKRIPQRAKTKKRYVALLCCMRVCESDSFWWDFTRCEKTLFGVEEMRKGRRTWIYAPMYVLLSREIIKNYFSLQHDEMEMNVEICERKMKYISDISSKLLRFTSHLIDWQVLELENYLRWLERIFEGSHGVVTFIIN